MKKLNKLVNADLNNLLTSLNENKVLLNVKQNYWYPLSLSKNNLKLI